MTNTLAMSDEAAESSSSQMKRQSSSTVGTGVAVGQTKTSSEQSSKMTCAWEAAWFPQSSTAFHVRTMLTDCVHEATSQLVVGVESLKVTTTAEQSSVAWRPVTHESASMQALHATVTSRTAALALVKVGATPVSVTVMIWFPLLPALSDHVRVMVKSASQFWFEMVSAKLTVPEAPHELEVALPRVDGEVPWLQNTLASAGTVKVFAPSIPKLTLKSEVDDRVTVWLLPLVEQNCPVVDGMLTVYVHGGRPMNE